ncbi:multidrug effflux MFS transporter [Granulosicoccus antarcticus]|uniref:Bcr/CflA family efflux transporter n=1 Tax=Granulosicoccus antarcticus IMCC3135 TaxID=1192854 RepID=A0A2Z2NNH8_9GAMM|nr:multidrug effflux MFS transporter [Granulosicoccus antarcticus]ASJ71491.1 Inner membrane transport protein YdhC [Granulosicoccus antarcticus IMCC3135]
MLIDSQKETEKFVMDRLGAPLLCFLIAVSAIGPLTLNGVLPATSAVMTELATRYEVAQLVLTVFLVANLVSQLVLGPAADRYGRRPVMLFSLSVFVVGSLICASANSIEWLLAGRFVQGVGGAVCVFLPRTIVRDIYEQGRAASVIGYMTTAMMVAPLFGPALGGWITDHASWRLMYAGLACLGILLLLAGWRYQPETLVSLRSKPSTAPGTSFFASSGLLLRDPGFVACGCMLAGSVGVYYGFLSGAPYLAMESRGLSATDYGRWFGMVAIGYLCGNLAAGKLSERLGVQKMIFMGFLPFLAGVALFWILLPLHHPVALFMPMMLAAFSNGMSLPSMFTVAMSIRPELSASASGLAGSLQTAFGVVLSIAIGYLLPMGDYWLFVLLTLSASISVVGLGLTIRLTRRQQISVARH